MEQVPPTGAPRPRTGLALGGGVARSVAHIGVLQALEDAGIPIDCVAGTSGGALIGAGYAAGLSPSRLEEAAQSLNWRRLVALRLRRDGLLDASGLEDLLYSLVGRRTFGELRIPFTAVAVDVVSGEEVRLSAGPVGPAVRASCAIPGLFIPVRLGGRTLVDGGVRNNLPTDVAREMGADVVIGVDVAESRHPGPPRNLVQIIFYSLDIMQQDRAVYLRSLADVMVVPNLGAAGFFELDRTAALVGAGRAAGEAAVDAIRRLLAQRRTGGAGRE